MKITSAIAVIGLVIGLSACETATPYQPLRTGSEASGGFSDQRLDQNHFRVNFQGNTVTSRNTVETYLLYRAAEVTVAQGYDWFETADRHTERDQQTYIDPLYGPYGYWSPRWRVWGGYGWGAWGPWGGGPWGGGYWGGATVSTVQKFQATAEIVMQHGPKPATDPGALDAHEVLANLGPKILRPKA
jgi:hypothetical protein